jgi:superfamily II DNA/RNA helicase
MLKDFVAKNKDKKILIFTETKDEAKQLCSLQYARFMGLHGDMEQRKRASVLDEYRDPKCRAILVATDVAARGLDIDDIDVVI